MPSTLFFSLIFTLTSISVNGFANIQGKRIQLTYEQSVIRHSSLSRFRRQSGGYGGYMQGVAAQPSVVVIPSVVPPLYRGPGSSYGPSTAYGAQGSSYGANRGPSVVVNMPESSSCNQKKKKKKKILDK